MQNQRKIHFEISERKILLRTFDVLFIIGSVFLTASLTDLKYFAHLESNLLWIPVLILYTTIFGTIFEMYNLQVSSYRLRVTKSLILTSIFVTTAFLFTPIFTPVFPNKRIELIFFYFIVLFSLLVWRFFYVYFLASTRFIKRLVLVCKSKDAERLVKDLVNADPHIQVLCYISVDEKNSDSKIEELAIQNIDNYLQNVFVSEIVVADSSKTSTLEIYNKLLEIADAGIPIKQYEEVYEDVTNRIPLHLKDKELNKYFPYTKNDKNRLYEFFIRFIDIVFSIIGLLFVAFLIPIIVILNFFWNKGPVFYKQERVGKNGRKFQIVKLRTMVVNAEKDGAVFAKTNDTRITPLGKWLRKTRLDEFPQFINVLSGEMSIIGPRPEREIFVKQIAEVIPLYHTRHAVKPGLTGWAQINYPYGESIEDSLMKLQYDLYYIKHRSLFLDVNIAVKTLGTIVYMKGQ